MNIDCFLLVTVNAMDEAKELLVTYHNGVGSHPELLLIHFDPIDQVLPIEVPSIIC